MNRRLVFVGDIHGEFREMIWKATQQYELRGADLVVLGDFGVGFDGKLKYDYGRAEKKMKEFDLEVYTIRGNHDDPDFFKDDDSEMSTLLGKTYPKIHFLADHRVYKIGGKDIYTIGGGGSTDIKFRTPGKDWWGGGGSTDIMMRTPGKDWWGGEYIVEKPIKDLPGRVDIVISHEAPLTFEPVISRFDETPEEQYQKILAGRKYLETVLKEVRCGEWYYGHYHQHYSGSYGEVLYKGLGISEFYEERTWQD